MSVIYRLSMKIEQAFFHDLLNLLYRVVSFGTAIFKPSFSRHNICIQ